MSSILLLCFTALDRLEGKGNFLVPQPQGFPTDLVMGENPWGGQMHDGEGESRVSRDIFGKTN